jgi:hypothetical protein
VTVAVVVLEVVTAASLVTVEDLAVAAVMAEDPVVEMAPVAMVATVVTAEVVPATDRRMGQTLIKVGALSPRYRYKPGLRNTLKRKPSCKTRCRPKLKLRLRPKRSCKPNHKPGHIQPMHTGRMTTTVTVLLIERLGISTTY